MNTKEFTVKDFNVIKRKGTLCTAAFVGELIILQIKKAPKKLNYVKKLSGIKTRWDSTQ